MNDRAAAFLIDLIDTNIASSCYQLILLVIELEF